MKHGEKDRALDGEAEFPFAQLALVHAADPELAPNPFHNHGGADLRHGPGAESSRLVPLDEPHFDRETREAFHDAVDVAFGLEAVEPTERRHDALPYFAALAEGFDDLQILVCAGRLRADEHGSLLSGHDQYRHNWAIRKQNIVISEISNIVCGTTFCALARSDPRKQPPLARLRRYPAGDCRR